VTVDADYSAIDSHQTRKRTKNRASSQNADSTTSVKSSNSGGHHYMQHSKNRKMPRKKFKKNSPQSAKDSVTVGVGLSEKTLEKKKAKHKRKKSS